MVCLMMTLASASAGAFNLSNTLGNGMVLQRAPHAAVVWGFGVPGTTIVTRVSSGTSLSTKVHDDGAWRQVLPPMPANVVPLDIAFTDGATNLTLRGVLFGDVYLCSGQSNMQCAYNPLTCMHPRPCIHPPMCTHESVDRAVVPGTHRTRWPA